MWCCYPNFISVLQFWSTLHTTYFWATIFFGQKITSPCTKNHFQFFAYIIIKGFCSMFSRCVIPCAFPNETFSILCLHCPQGTLFYILHAWSFKSSLVLCHMSLTKDSHRSHASLSCSWWPHIFSFHIPCQSPALLLTYIHGPNGKARWISFWESHSKVWKHSFIDRRKYWNSCLSELDSS